MECSRCKSKDILSVSAKCHDSCYIERSGIVVNDGYVDNNLGIGSGDYIVFHYCGNCGQIQGTFPLRAETDKLVQALTDPENQPHQYVGRPEDLKKRLEGITNAAVA